MTRVLVTRPSRQAMSLADALRAQHLDPICVPTVEIEPAMDPALQHALADLDQFDWLVVTSANAVAPLMGHVRDTIKVAAVGAVTAEALQRAGIRVDHVPDRFVSAAIAAGLGDLIGRHVLLAQADAAASDLRDALIERGAIVTSTVAYHTIEAPPGSREPLHEALDRGIDLLTFASPSAVRGLVKLLDPGRLGRAQRIPTACIGPVTATEAEASGFAVEIVPERHVAEDLARAIAERLREKVA